MLNVGCIRGAKRPSPARGDAEGIELTMTVDDPALVPELRRRAAHDLEAAQHRQHAMK
jgi:hypothetical protein